MQPVTGLKALANHLTGKESEQKTSWPCPTQLCHSYWPGKELDLELERNDSVTAVNTNKKVLVKDGDRQWGEVSQESMYAHSSSLCLTSATFFPSETRPVMEVGGFLPTSKGGNFSSAKLVWKRERERYKQTERDTARERHTHTQKETDRQTDRQRERGERQKEKRAHKWLTFVWNHNIFTR